MFLAAAFSLALAGVSALAGGGDAERGRKLFHDTGDYAYPSCAHCHAAVPAKDEVEKARHRRPGFPIYDSAHRGAWKNKARGKGPATAGDAGNTCVVAFQKRKKLDAARVADLNAYITSLSPNKAAKPRRIGYAPALPESLDGGDPEKGKKKVALHCGGCHGPGDEHLQYPLKAAKHKKRKVAMKVRGWIEDEKRESGMRFKPDTGQMSFFAKDRLPDEDLLDILAYLGKK
jgi:mono/diheme cytochrome c family protein